MDDYPREFAKNYPTTGCLFGCAIAGVIGFAIFAPLAYAFVVWLLGDFNP